MKVNLEIQPAPEGGVMPNVKITKEDGSPLTCITSVDLHLDSEGPPRVVMGVLGHQWNVLVKSVEAEFPEIAELRRENAQLKDLLQQNGIGWNNEGSAA